MTACVNSRAAFVFDRPVSILSTFKAVAKSKVVVHVAGIASDVCPAAALTFSRTCRECRI